MKKTLFSYVLGCFDIATGPVDVWIRVGVNPLQKATPPIPPVSKVTTRAQKRKADEVWDSMQKRRDKVRVQTEAVRKAKSKMLVKGNFARIDYGVLKGRDMGERLESIAVQYHALERFPASVRTYTNQQASSGQVQMGPSVKRHLDQLLVFEGQEGTEWLCINVHEHGSHGAMGVQGHEPSCRKFTGKDVQWNEDTVALDKYLHEYCESMTASGLIKMKYLVVSQCQLICGNALPVTKRYEGIYGRSNIDLNNLNSIL